MSFHSIKRMSRSAFSLFAFSLYMFVIGLLLLVAPNLLLSIFGVPQTHEVWIRIVGILVLIIGCTDFMAARVYLLIYLRWSVWTRLAAALCLSGLALLDTAPPVLFLFAAIDGAAAIWTAACLRSEGAANSGVGTEPPRVGVE